MLSFGYNGEKSFGQSLSCTLRFFSQRRIWAKEKSGRCDRRLGGSPYVKRPSSVSQTNLWDQVEGVPTSGHSGPSSRPQRTRAAVAILVVVANYYHIGQKGVVVWDRTMLGPGMRTRPILRTRCTRLSTVAGAQRRGHRGCHWSRSRPATPRNSEKSHVGQKG